MNLLQLTIETFDKNVETDFTSLKNHLNYIENYNTVVNGLTFAFFGLTEIIIKRVYLTFELNSTIHTIERMYRNRKCILQCDGLKDEEAKHHIHNILNMNYNQFLHQFIMPSSFIETWIQSPTEEFMRSFVSTKPVMTSDTKMIEEQINDTMAFLNSYEDYKSACAYITKNKPYLSLYSNHLDQLEKSLEDKKKKVLREIELVTELDDMEKKAAIRKKQQQTIDRRREGLNELSLLYDEYLLSQDHLFDLEQSYSRAVYLYGSENDDYMRMYHHYMNSLAGILAKDLKEGTPCPVCGSFHHPKPCLIEGREVSQELLFKKEAILEKTREDLEKKRIEKATYMVRHQRLIEKIIQKKKELNITEDISKEMFIRELSVLNTDYLSHYKKDKKLLDEIGYLHKLEKHLPALKQDYHEILMAIEEVKEEYLNLEEKIKNAEMFCDDIIQKYSFIMYVDEDVIENKKKECLNNQKILTLLHKQTIPLEEDVTSFITQLMNTANRLLKQITHDRLQLILDNKLYLQEEDHFSLVEDSSMIGLCTIVLGYSLSSLISHQDILFIDDTLQYKMNDYHETLIHVLSTSPCFSKLYITDSVITAHYYQRALD
ncbi:hypothetical protein CATMIT_01035 [Catenibacterium mitsuokai DSM 15897]|uniref:hypothetical protein n=1 Tax=Catenibacterium mitsuokai TaxID=100886 RepID=UPI000196B74B|nr:hypothetical protein [Catenibacterium mitsuokai]EEF94318.1 hypothetical protein CATMIT_01035 [Catenibacterium mitsuokai DSM 15897]UWO52411.1 hypothetical protein NQ499_09100 [Catenibacterium mitsuokai]